MPIPCENHACQQHHLLIRCRWLLKYTLILRCKANITRFAFVTIPQIFLTLILTHDDHCLQLSLTIPQTPTGWDLAIWTLTISINRQATKPKCEKLKQQIPGLAKTSWRVYHGWHRWIALLLPAAFVFSHSILASAAATSDCPHKPLKARSKTATEPRFHRFQSRWGLQGAIAARTRPC